MKKNKYISILLIVLLFGTSCDDMLDLTPETDPSDAVMWTSASAFERGANEFYNYLPKISSHNDIVGLIDKEEWSDVRMWKDGENSTSNSTYSVPDVDKAYENYYKHVRAINYLFKNAASYSNQSEIMQYVAEAHFFRAFVSLRAFVDYGPLTIVNEVMEVSSPELYAARDSRDAFINFIIEDLEAAINSNALPKQADIVSSSTNGRITIGAAQALLARACLFEGTWQKYHNNNTTRANELLNKAADNASKVMNDNSYVLFYNEALGETSYRWLFVLENEIKCNPANVQKDANKEYIFRNRFHERIRQSNQNVTHRANGLSITRKLVELYLDRDGKDTKPDYKTSLNSYYKDRDPRLASISNAVGDLRWSYESPSTFERNAADSANAGVRSWNGCGLPTNKFGGERGSGGSDDGFDVPIIRLAEVYLTYAEAKCELGTLTDNDLELSINKLRTRVHMPKLLSSTVPDGSTMLKEIRRERTCELYGEGFRYDDLRRWKTAETEMSMSLEGVWMGEGSAYARDWELIYTTGQANFKYLASQNEGYSKSAEGYAIHEDASRRKFETKHYLRPLPKKQIELNPNLEQNPGW